MIFIFILFSLVCLPSLSVSTSQGMITALEQEIQKVAATIPANAGKFVNNIHSQGNFNSDTFDISQTNQILQNKWKLSPQIIQKFTNILYEESLIFQTFSENLDQSVAYLNEFIGAARRVGNSAEIAYIQVSSSGNALTQYDVVETKHCHRTFIFFHHCTTDHHSVPRGFKTDELQVIFTALRASAYAYLLKQIQTPPSSIAHFDSMRESMLELNEKLFPKNSSVAAILGVSDNHDSLITQLIENIIQKVPEIERDLEQNRTTVVDKIVDRGFTTFKEQADIEQHNGVSDEYFNAFLDNLRSDLNLPANYDSQFKETMQVTLFSNSNVWVVFNIIFSINTGADCKFVCVMASHDSVNKKTDWLVANVGATFELAPNLLVVQTKHSYAFGAWSDSEEKIVLKPSSLSQNNLDLVFEFFEVVSFQRFAEFLNINSPHLALSDPKPLGDVIAALGLVKSAITIVTSTWQSIVDAFKTTKSTELKQILQGNGFNYYSQSGEMQKVTGLVESYYDTFANELLGRIQVPDDKKTAFQQFFGDFKYIEDDNEWKAFHTVFSIGTGGECKFVAILAHHNTTTHTIDLLIGDFVASFKLAPNVAVIQESASYAGGIYSNSKVVFKDIPRSVTEDDLKAIFDFFYIVTYKNFGDMVGVSVNFPSLH